jgi:hypothetical protein
MDSEIPTIKVFDWTRVDSGTRVVSMSESRMVVLPGPRIGPVFPPPENLTGDQFAAFMDAQE